MYLFAYGTLKRGGKYHFYLEEAELVEEHVTISGSLYDTGLGYPALELAGDDVIQGELYDIPDVLWPAINDLEDYTGNAKTDMYDRLTIDVETKRGTKQAIVYTAKAERLLKEYISEGIWDVERSFAR
ncbi:gamma-glutamylcyclotransferase family protein [Planococcus maritimus]|uniref:gamma-glutamylcyclotransferase family protein n=1 Tax=Planococcus maritimus TaxID=192421 RepID=UPI00232D5FC1|nr:gamma-glutamylcyclotransferase [Planococcus maritimus]